MLNKNIIEFSLEFIPKIEPITKRRILFSC